MSLLPLFGIASASPTILTYDFTGVTSSANWPTGFSSVGGYDGLPYTVSSGYIRATYSDSEEFDAYCQIKFDLSPYIPHGGGSWTGDKYEGSSPTPGALTPDSGTFGANAPSVTILNIGVGSESATCALDNFVITINP